MQASLYKKLQQLAERYRYIGEQMGLPEVIADLPQYQKLVREYAKLEQLVESFQRYQQNEAALKEAKMLVEDADGDLRAMAQEEIQTLSTQQETLETQLQAFLIPEDPDDHRNVYLEIRAGTGGDEAALFAGDLLRMYQRFADNHKLRLTIVSENLGEHGGYKEVITQVKGGDVFAKLKFESGTHRVQRVPETESQGRIHTSACTVAVLPEIEEVDELVINPADLRIDTYRSSGAGGQHVNTTDSAVRITHVPTGIVVECQDERSQHKNRARAMGLLQSKIVMEERKRQHQEQAETRRNLVGSGDRSERIRTYNFPQGRVTDHRINLTLYKLDEILLGDLEAVIEPLLREHQADQLAALQQDND